MRRAPLQQQALSGFAELFDNAGLQHVQNARLCVRQLPAGDARAQVCIRPRCLPRLQRAQHLQKLHGLTQTTLRQQHAALSRKMRSVNGLANFCWLEHPVHGVGSISMRMAIAALDTLVSSNCRQLWMELSIRWPVGSLAVSALVRHGKVGRLFDDFESGLDDESALLLVPSDHGR